MFSVESKNLGLREYKYYMCLAEHFWKLNENELINGPLNLWRVAFYS